LSGQPINKEFGEVGGQFFIDLEVRDSGNALVNADSLPTYSIYTPNLTLHTQGTAVQISIGYYEAQFALGFNEEVSDNWKIIWSWTQASVQNSFQEFFIAKPEGGSTFGGVVSIADNWLAQIKSVLGYPVTGNILLEDDQIKELCVFPALQQYSIKFPQEHTDQYPISGNLEVPFPNDATFGTLDSRVINKIAGQTPQSGSNFFQLYLFNQTRYNGGRSPWNVKGYGTRYNFNNLQEQQFMQNQLNDTINNQYGTFKSKVDYQNRKVIAYSSIGAILQITWASYSFNFNSVKFSYTRDVIKLAQGYLLLHLADIGSLMEDSEQTIKLNAEALKTRGSDLITEVTTRWIAVPSVVILRGE
jgi:hypothetical protein